MPRAIRPSEGGRRSANPIRKHPPATDLSDSALAINCVAPGGSRQSPCRNNNAAPALGIKNAEIRLLTQPFARAVTAPAVNNDDLGDLIRACRRFAERFKRRGQVVALVEDRDDDGDFHSSL